MNIENKKKIDELLKKTHEFEKNVKESEIYDEEINGRTASLKRFKACNICKDILFLTSLIAFPFYAPLIGDSSFVTCYNFIAIFAYIISEPCILLYWNFKKEKLADMLLYNDDSHCYNNLMLFGMEKTKKEIEQICEEEKKSEIQNLDIKRTRLFHSDLALKRELSRLDRQIARLRDTKVDYKYNYDYEYMFDMGLYTNYDLAKKVDEKKELKYYKKYGNDGTSPYY